MPHQDHAGLGARAAAQRPPQPCVGDSRLQPVEILPVRHALLAVREAVGQHGAYKAGQLLLLAGTV